MLDTEKDIKIAKDFLNHNNSKYKNTEYRNPYDTLNEDIDFYYKYFPIKDKNVLTVSSSGDHILKALYKGASNIYAFDNNPFAIYASKLKIIACLYLDYHDYMKYYYNTEEDSYFDINIYIKIREYLDNETRYFWDSLYKETKFIRNPLNFFLDGEYGFTNKENSIKNYDNYYIAKENINLNNIHLYNEDLFKILNKIPKDIKFDSIFLSDIYKFLKKDKRKFIKFVKNDLSDSLSDIGIIAVYARGNKNSNYSESLEKEFKMNIENKNGKVIVYKK